MRTSLEYSQSLIGVNEFSRGIAIPATLHTCEDLCPETSVALLRVDQGIYRFQSPIPFAPDAQIEICLEGCKFKGELVCCQELPCSAFLLIVQRIYEPRRALRTGPRISANFMADLRSPSCDRMYVKITNMSRSGLGLDELSCEIKEGTRVSVHFDAGVAFGEIRHCSASTRGCFRAGLQIFEFIARIRESDSAERERRAAFPCDTPEREFDLYLRSLTRTLQCALSGHKYRWVADSWDRAVLRCSRCQRDLERSYSR